MAKLQSPVTAICLGCLCAIGQSPIYFWPASLLALLLFLSIFVNWSSENSRVFKNTLFFGFGYFMVTMNWIVEPFLVDVHSHGWLAPLALSATAGVLSVFWAVGAYLGYLVFKSVSGLALGIGLSEVARGFFFTGFPWGLLGYIWTDTPVAQMAAYIGVYGLTLTTVFLCGIVLEIARHKGFFTSTLYFLAAISGIWVLGNLRMSEPTYTDVVKIIRLSQPNATQEQKWHPEYSKTFYNRQLEYILKDPKPDLVIWPETALPIPLEMAGPLVQKMADTADGIPVLFGALRFQEGQYFNSIIYLNSHGTAVPIYDKHHLVPFGEYLPFEHFFEKAKIKSFGRLFATGFATGAGPAVVEIKKLGKVFPVICYESVFPQYFVGLKQRPALIMQVTNDAWFGHLSGPQQHLSKAQMRSIETGLPLVRVANTGISGLIDPFGRLLDNLPLDEAGYLDVRVPQAIPVTLFSYLGLSVVAYLALLFGSICFFSSRVFAYVDEGSK